MALPLSVPRGGIKTISCANDVAVVIVDMQQTYVGYTTKQKRERLILAHRQLLEGCASHDIPVAVLEMASDGQTVPDVSEMLRPLRRIEFMTKNEADGFWRTFLAHHLRQWHVGRLVVTGCLASACVRATVTSALFHGYKVRTAEVLIADADCHGIEPDSDKWYRKNDCLREPCIEQLLGAA